MADEQVRIDIVADDQASKKIDTVAKKVDALESGQHDIPIGADTADAERDVKSLLTKVEGLARDPATILLSSNAVSIAGQIADLITDLDKLSASDPTVQVKVDQINTLQGDLDQVEAKLRDINGLEVAPDTTKAKKGLDDVAKSADSSKSVLANMVGNATQDLGALGGVAGSAGVAIGQMGEYMADARASGEGMGSVLKSFAGVAGPIAAIGLVTKLISDHFAKLDEDAKVANDQMKRFAGSIRDGASDAGVLRDELKATSELKFRVQIEGPDIDVGDITGPMKAAGLDIEHFIALSKLSNEEFRKWADGAEAAGVKSKDLAAISLGLAGYAQQVATAQDLAANTAAALGEKQTTMRDAMLGATVAQRDHVDALDAAAAAARDTAGDTARLQVATDRAEQSTRNMTAAWDELTGRLDTEQAVANLGSDFDDMRTKSVNAWNATAQGAADAQAKQDDYAQSVRDAKGDVVNLGKQIGLSIPEVKAMLLKIDSGEIDDVERSLNIMARNRTMNLSIIASGGTGYGVGPGGSSGPRAVLPPAAPVEVVNVTQHLPRGWRGDALGEARAAARRSGGLYRRTRR